MAAAAGRVALRRDRSSQTAGAAWALRRSRARRRRRARRLLRRLRRHLPGTSLYNRTADHYDPQSPNRAYDSHLYSTSRDDSPGAGRAGLGYSPLRDSYESPGRPGAGGAGGGGGGGAPATLTPMELSPTESPILSPAASPHRPAGGSGYGWQC